MSINRWDTESDGPLSEETLRAKLEGLGYRVNRYIYPPGTVFPDHAHTVDKMDAVVSGSFRMRMGDLEVVLSAGDSLVVPRGELHSAEVVGAEPVVSLDGVRYAE